MNNGEIVLFQSSDGLLHTISLTPEQIADLGLQVQYPTPSTSIENITPQYHLEILKDPNKKDDNCVEIAPPETINNLIPQSIVEETPVEVQTHTVPIHKVIRLKKNKGFHLITDHIKTSSQPKLETSLIRTININNSVITTDSSSGLVQQSNINNNGIKNGSMLSGKYIVTHNEIGSFKPDTKNIIRNVTNNRVHIQNTPIANSIGGIDSGGQVTSNVRNIIKKGVKNGVQLKTVTKISGNVKKNLNVNVPLTPLSLAPKPVRKVLIQPDVTGWKDSQPQKTVHVLQTGNQYQSVERLNGEQLRVVTDALSNVVARPKNKNNVLYDPTSKTRIVYRVVYPEDLNLYSVNNESEESKKAKRTLKPKPSIQGTSQTKQVVSVTRSGRQVRPPRHMTQDYEHPEDDLAVNIPSKPENNGALPLLPSEENKQELEDYAKIEKATRQIFGRTPPPVTSHRKKLICPFCRKTYHGANRMARHLFIFPDHAITERMVELLEKYRAQNQTKDPIPKVKPKPNMALTDPQNNPVPPVNHVKKNETEKIISSDDLESKEERNLFVSLVGIIERTSEECQAAVFIRQLAALIIKLKRLMPCLLFEDKSSSSCIISEPIGKMLDVSPGKYRLNMNAIKCLGEQGGNCTHIKVNQEPVPKPVTTPSWITNVAESKSEEPQQQITTPSSWITNAKSDKIQVDDCATKDPMEKWTTNVGKRKWIPIGTRDSNENSNTNDENWLSNNSEMLMDNASFSQTVDNLKNWDSALQKQSRISECTPSSPWQANIAELSKMDIPQEINGQNLIINSSSQPVPSDDSLTFDCPSKMVDNLVFDMKRDISLDTDNINLKNNLSCNGQNACEETVGPENYDFNDSRFDMQIDSDKLNFTSAQYNEMRYGRDSLPPFRKIEPSKNLQLPVDALSDMSSDGDKIHLPTSDTILSNSNYQITSESLGLTMDNSHINPLTAVESCKNVTLNPNENAVHCDGQSLLNTSDLNLPISSASTLSRNESMLSVSESSLDGARMNLSSSLHLLDPLGTDCLSFADSELRPTSQMSLDLQLDLFPFHHP